MTRISVSKLKENPSAAIGLAEDYPVAIENRSKVKAYIIGKDLYEKLVSYLEEYADSKVIENTDFSKGTDFEKVAKELGI